VNDLTIKVPISIGSTAMSATGLTETEIGTGVTVPAGKNCLRGIRAYYVSAATIDSLTRIPIFRLYSQDVLLEPCQFLGEVQSASTTSGNGNQWPSTYFPINAPVKGSNLIHAYCQLAVTANQAGVAGITFYFTDEGPRGSWYHYKLPTTLTPVPTVVTAATANISTNPITLTGAKKLTAAYGAVWQTTEAAGTGCFGKFKLTSTDFADPVSPEFFNEGGNSFLSAGNSDFHLTKVGHELIDDPDFDIPLKQGNTVNIIPVFTNGPTNIVGAFLMGVQYI
jgi:hypothetical protein